MLYHRSLLRTFYLSLPVPEMVSKTRWVGRLGFRLINHMLKSILLILVSIVLVAGSSDFGVIKSPCLGSAHCVKGFSNLHHAATQSVGVFSFLTFRVELAFGFFTLTSLVLFAVFPVGLLTKHLCPYPENHLDLATPSHSGLHC